MPTLRVNVIRAEDLLAADSNGCSDPFVTLMLNEKGFKKLKTKVVKKTLTPVWNQTFYIDVRTPLTSVIHLEVYDHDLLKANDLIGLSEVALVGLTQGSFLSCIQRFLNVVCILCGCVVYFFEN